MLLRISLILAILAGIGTIVVTQKMARDQIQTVITERNDHIQKENQERSGRKKAEQTLASTSNLLNQTKQNLAKTEENLNTTKQTLASREAAIAKLDADLKSATEARNTAQQELQRWEQVGKKPEEIRDLIANYKKAQDAIAALEDEKKILARSVEEWKNKYRLAMGDETDTPLPAGTTGKIVAVDPKWNFVVLNIGRDKGMLERGILLVHRQSKYIGKVRIAEVMEHRCIANVVPGTSLDELQEGDQVLN